VDEFFVEPQCLTSFSEWQSGAQELRWNPVINERWFEKSFGEDYPTFYQHRDTREAQAVADLVYAHIPGVPSRPVLDVACGAGRHLPYLKRDRMVVGIDLSAFLLGRARAANPQAWLLQADMRELPFESGFFGLVVNLFTSFGYFSDDGDNRQALAEIARVTASGGWFVMDFLNAPQVRRKLVHSDRKQAGSRFIEQMREISADGLYVEKTIKVSGAARTFYERVRLFEPGDLAVMLRDAGFRVTQLLGDYEGNLWHQGSDRAILMAQKR
jgi:SAM-dependent methyltransferase